MKRLFYSVAMLSILMFACSIPSTVVPTVATQPPEVTNTPVVTEATAPVTNVTCNELALYLDPALASGYNCETVPESAEGMEINPQYTKLTLQGYVLSGKFFTPHISVFPVQRYNELLPDFVPGRVSDLQALIGGGAAGDTLPLLPSFNAAQIFHAQYQEVPFMSGSGIRFLAEYAQYFAPVNNNDLFYTYQGLTSDGKYWVSVILPINNPILPANGDNPPGGLSWDEFNNNYGPYITDMVSQLNSQTSGSYTPALAALDALVGSITIQP
ncbi:MAG TPA: hypothetical protein VII97_02340 [Anaerolineales bacterium]